MLLSMVFQMVLLLENMQKYLPVVLYYWGTSPAVRQQQIRQCLSGYRVVHKKCSAHSL